MTRRDAPRRWRDSRLAAIFEEQHFCCPVAKVEANRAVASDVVRQHAAACPPAVHLMDAEMIANVKLTPGLDENGAARFVGEEGFERGPFVFEIGQCGFCFECGVIQAARREQSGRGQIPRACDHAHAHARVEAGCGVLPRMGAKRDAQRSRLAHLNCNPEVVDVSRVPVDFGGEGDRFTRNVDHLSVPRLKFGILAALSASVWQSEDEYGAA